MFAINTDDQLKIELPLITSGFGIIQGKKWWFYLIMYDFLDSNTNTTAACFYSLFIVANFGERLCGIDNVKCQKWFINIQHTYANHKIRKLC